MSLLKAKQVQLASPNSLLIGNDTGLGATLAIGASGSMLRVVGAAPSWYELLATDVPFTSTHGLTATNVSAALDELEVSYTSINPAAISSAYNIVNTQTSTGVVIDVENAAQTGSFQLATFVLGPSSDEQFLFSSSAGMIHVTASGTATNVGISIEPKAAGIVKIGGSAPTLQTGANLDLTILGGSGAGNLILNGGGTGKIYYSTTATNPAFEVATLNDIQQNQNAHTITNESFVVTGTTVPTVPSSTIVTSVRISVNGLMINDDNYSINSSHQVIFNPTAMQFSLDETDEVEVTYENATGGLGDLSLVIALDLGVM